MKKTSVIIILLLVFAVISLCNGKFQIDLSEFTKIFLDTQSAQHIVLFDLRLPRVICAILIGTALGTAGGAYQNMFVNPLVSPSILGVLSGASFGAALAMVLDYNIYLQMLFTFIFGFAAVFLAILIAQFAKGKSIIMLVLGGVISSSFFGSLLATLKYAADPNDTLPAITYFLMGSLSFAMKETVYISIIPIVLGAMIIILLAKQIDALSLGEEEAKALGVDVRKLKILLILLATLISALSVMLAGIIGWIGLIVPHIARFVFGANSKTMLINSALIGALFLLICDFISMNLFDYEIPIGIVSSFFGIPVFVAVLFSRTRFDRA